MLLDAGSSRLRFVESDSSEFKRKNDSDAASKSLKMRKFRSRSGLLRIT